MPEKFLLKKVTPKAMKVLGKHGLLEKTGVEQAGKILDISMNEAALQECCEVMFQDDFSKMDWEELNLSDFVEGYNRFLRSFWNPTGKLTGSMKN